LRTRRYVVTGRVQGVGYRASARAAALRLGLAGWVRNLPDGRVEACAVGDDTALADFEAWLRRGPRLSRVDRVESVDVPFADYADFLIR
jgi:acylphosphatase